MLTAVKNQIRCTLLTSKYAIMREMLNSVTFVSRIVFMMINNASFLVQWIIIYGLCDSIGTYGLKEIILVWGFSASSYGFAHFFFANAFRLPTLINEGKLDQYIIQPKNVLITAITTKIWPSALGDLLYGFIMYFIYGFTPLGFLLFVLFTILGGLITVACAIIISSLSFWFGKSDVLLETYSTIMTTTSLYPDAIYGSVIKIILFTIIPVGFVVFLPVSIMQLFNPMLLLIILGFTALLVAFAFITFYAGLKKYSSSNLMNARI